MALCSAVHIGRDSYALSRLGDRPAPCPRGLTRPGGCRPILLIACQNSVESTGWKVRQHQTSPNHVERVERPMAKSDLLDVSYLRQRLSYDPMTGAITWRDIPDDFFPDVGTVSRWRARRLGKEAFATISGGYKIGAIDGINVKAHRVAWALYHGAWPTGQIDHINRDKADNRIVNLREASNAENSVNKPPLKGSVSRYKGVSFSRESQRWVASARLSGVKKHLGLFDTEVLAARAYDNAVRQSAGPFAYLNFPD